MLFPRPGAASVFLSALLAACFPAGTTAFASAWNAPPGSLSLRLSYVAVSANDQFGFDGSTRPIVDGMTDYPFEDRSAYLSLEYGLWSRVTILATLPLRRIVVHDRLFRYQTEGLGDVSAGARVGILSRGPWVLSGISELQIPTGYHRDSKPPLGAGQMDLTAGLEAGRSFYPRPAYGVATLRYRWRSSLYVSNVSDPGAAPEKVDYSDEVLYSLEFGWTFQKRMMVKPLIRGAYSLRSAGNAFTLTSLPSTERYLKAGGGASVNFASRYEASFEALQTLTGRNTSKSIDLILGVAAQW